MYIIKVRFGRFSLIGIPKKTTDWPPCYDGRAAIV